MATNLEEEMSSTPISIVRYVEKHEAATTTERYSHVVGKKKTPIEHLMEKEGKAFLDGKDFSTRIRLDNDRAYGMITEHEIVNITDHFKDLGLEVKITSVHCTYNSVEFAIARLGIADIEEKEIHWGFDGELDANCPVKDKREQFKINWEPVTPESYT
jgi:hypothetical protein